MKSSQVASFSCTNTKSSTQTTTAVNSFPGLRNRQQSATDALKPMSSNSAEKVSQFESAARWSLRKHASDGFSIFAPVGRHLHPDLTINRGCQKRRLHIARFDETAMLCSHSQKSTQSDHRSKGVVEIQSLLHELASDDNTGLVLIGLEELLINRWSTVLELEDPVSRNRFDSFLRVLPFFTEGAILDVALLFPVHSRNPLH